MRTVEFRLTSEDHKFGETLERLRRKKQQVLEYAFGFYNLLMDDVKDPRSDVKMIMDAEGNENYYKGDYCFLKITPVTVDSYRKMVGFQYRVWKKG